MKTLILEVKEIPFVKKEQLDDYYSMQRSSLMSALEFCSLIKTYYNREILLELGFLTDAYATVRIFVIIRYADECNEIHELHKQMESFLAHNSYIFSRLYQEEKQIIDNRITEYIAKELFCIVKREEIQNIGVQNVSYKVDSFLRQEGCCIDYIGDVINALANYPETFFAIQLIPVQVNNNEKSAIRRVVNNFKNGFYVVNPNNIGHIQDMSKDMPSIYNQYLYEGIFFQYNILIAAKSNALGISEQIRNVLATRIGMNLEVVKFNENVFVNSHVSFYWVMNNTLLKNYRNKRIWMARLVDPLLFRLPYLVSGNEALQIFSLPINCGNISSVKSNYIKAKRVFISPDQEKDSVQLGFVRNASDLVKLYCSLNTFTKHAVITGMPGFGKTTFAIDLLMQFWKKDIPFIVIEPSKEEYRAMLAAIPDLQVFTPGNSRVSPFIANPFIPPKGVTLETHRNSLKDAFAASFSMPEPLDKVFNAAISRVYNLNGWTDISTIEDPNIQIFGMMEFVKVFRVVVAEFSYDAKYKGTLNSAGLLRLMDIIELNGNIFDTINTIPPEAIISKPTVIELNAIENTEVKSLIIVLLLLQIQSYIKANRRSGNVLKNIFMLDEAHVILEKTGHSMTNGTDVADMAIEIIKRMVAEFRSYGMGIIIADQKPSVISNKIITNVGLKLSFRLNVEEERYLIQTSTNMSGEDAEQLGYLKKGEAFIHYDDLEEPLLINTRDSRKIFDIGLGISDDEVRQKNVFWKENKKLLIPYKECRFCQQCSNTCDLNLKALSEYYARYFFDKFKLKIKTARDLKLYMMKLHHVIIKAEMKKEKTKDIKKLVNCTKIKFFRKCISQLDISLSDKETDRLFLLVLLRDI